MSTLLPVGGEPRWRRPWYLRWGAERADRQPRTCHEVCAQEDPSPTDLFCRAYAFLPLARASVGVRRFALGLLATLPAGAVSLSATRHTPVPLLVLALGYLVLFVLAPLRHHPTTLRAAVAVLLVAGAVGGVARWGEGSVRTVVLTAALGGTALLWAWYAGQVAWYGGWTGIVPRSRTPRRSRDRHEGWMLPGAVTFGSAASALPVLLVGRVLRYVPEGWLWVPPAAVRLWLARTPWLGLLGALFTAVLTGLLHGVRTFDPKVEPLLSAPPVFPLLTLPRPRWEAVPAGGPLEQLALVLLSLCGLLATTLLAVGCVAVNILIKAGEYTCLAIVFVLDVVWWVGVSVVRLVAAVLERSVEVVGQAAVLGGGALLRSLRVVVLPVVLTGVQLVCAWDFASCGNSYRESGSSGDLAVAVLTAAAGYAASVATWVLWCGERLGPSARSAGRSGRNVLVWTLVVVPFTSWLVCGQHLLTGRGAVAPGLITWSSTALLLTGALAGIVQWLRGGKPAVP